MLIDHRSVHPLGTLRAGLVEKCKTDERSHERSSRVMMYLPRCGANVTEAGISFRTYFPRSFFALWCTATPIRSNLKEQQSTAAKRTCNVQISRENSVLYIRRCYASSFRARTCSLQKARTREKARVKVLNTVRQVRCILKGFHSNAHEKDV